MLQNIPASKVRDFEEEYLHYLEINQAPLLADLRQGKLDDTILDQLGKIAAEISAKYEKK